jgi:hypothetical protein
VLGLDEGKEGQYVKITTSGVVVDLWHKETREPKKGEKENR